MKTIILTIFTICTLGLYAQSAREISNKATEAIEIGDMEMTSTIEIYDNKGNVRTRQISTATRKFGACSKTLIRFLSPADVKGTSLLIYDYENENDNMWIYMPALRKVRRILSNEKGKNFMGSEFTNADMSKPNADDFTYADAGNQTINGVNCKKIETKPKTDAIRQENNFSKKISYIDPANYLCYRIEFYDQAGKLQKVQTIGKYEKQSGGKYFAHRMEMQNVQNQRKSVLIVNKIQAGSNLPESKFSPNTLNQ